MKQKTPAQITAEAEEQRSELRQYCKQCTDAQVQNVYQAEYNRAKACSSPYSEVGAVAKVFADEAKQECSRRGLM